MAKKFGKPERVDLGCLNVILDAKGLSLEEMIKDAAIQAKKMADQAANDLRSAYDTGEKVELGHKVAIQDAKEQFAKVLEQAKKDLEESTKTADEKYAKEIAPIRDSIGLANQMASDAQVLAQSAENLMK